MGLRLALVVTGDGPRRIKVLGCPAQCPRRAGPEFILRLAGARQQAPLAAAVVLQRVLWRLWVSPRRPRRGSPRCRPPEPRLPRAATTTGTYSTGPATPKYATTDPSGPRIPHLDRRCNAQDAPPASSFTSESGAWLHRPINAVRQVGVAFSRG